MFVELLKLNYSSQFETSTS